MAIFLSIGTIITVLSKDSLLNYTILITGIFCVVLAAKGNIWNYGFGVFNSIGYAYVSYVNGLYGEMCLNIFFFLPTGIIGFLMWNKHLDSTTVEMRGLRIAHQILLFVCCAFVSILLGFVLGLIKTQNTPYIDAASTILSIAATLLMMWRFKEQWILYITLNTVNIVMWLIRIRNGSEDGPMMVLMWSAFLVNAIYGFINWRKGSMHIATLEQT